MDLAVAAFEQDFAPWALRLPADDVAAHRAGRLEGAGWVVLYEWGADRRGVYLDYYAALRETADERVDGDWHTRLYADGTRQTLPPVLEAYLYGRDPYPEELQRARSQYVDSLEPATDAAQPVLQFLDLTAASTPAFGSRSSADSVDPWADVREEAESELSTEGLLARAADTDSLPPSEESAVFPEERAGSRTLGIAVDDVTFAGLIDAPTDSAATSDAPASDAPAPDATGSSAPAIDALDGGLRDFGGAWGGNSTTDDVLADDETIVGWQLPEDATTVDASNPFASFLTGLTLVGDDAAERSVTDPATDATDPSAALARGGAVAPVAPVDGFEQFGSPEPTAEARAHEERAHADGWPGGGGATVEEAPAGEARAEQATVEEAPGTQPAAAPPAAKQPPVEQPPVEQPPGERPMPMPPARIPGAAGTSRASAPLTVADVAALVSAAERDDADRETMRDAATDSSTTETAATETAATETATTEAAATAPAANEAAANEAAASESAATTGRTVTSGEPPTGRNRARDRASVAGLAIYFPDEDEATEAATPNADGDASAPVRPRTREPASNPALGMPGTGTSTVRPITARPRTRDDLAPVSAEVAIDDFLPIWKRRPMVVRGIAAAVVMILLVVGVVLARASGGRRAAAAASAARANDGHARSEPVHDSTADAAANADASATADSAASVAGTDGSGEPDASQPPAGGASVAGAGPSPATDTIAPTLAPAPLERSRTHEEGVARPVGPGSVPAIQRTDTKTTDELGTPKSAAPTP